MKTLSKGFITNSSTVATVVCIKDENKTSLKDWLEYPLLINIFEFVIDEAIPKFYETVGDHPSLRFADVCVGGDYPYDDEAPPTSFPIAYFVSDNYVADGDYLHNTFEEVITKTLKKVYPDLDLEIVLLDF